MQAFLVRGACADMLQTAQDSLGYLETVSVHLFKNDVSVSRDTVLADLEECDFTGYQAVTGVTFGEVHVGPSNKARMVGELAQFHASGSTVTNTVYGFYVLAAGGELAAVGRFDNPIPVSGEDDAVMVIPEIQLDSSWTQPQI